MKRLHKPILALLVLMILGLSLLFLTTASVQAAPVQNTSNGAGTALASLRPPPTDTPTPLPSPSPTPTPIPPPTAQQGGKVYWGGRGDNGTCFNPAGSPAAILKQDFNWGPDHLRAKYQNDTSDILCNDNWDWFQDTNVPTAQFLATMLWPGDLFADPQPPTIPAHFMPLAYPSTTINLCPDPNNCGGVKVPPAPNPACIWHGPLGQNIDVCAPIRALVNAGAGAIRWIYGTINSQIGFLWKTPTQPFTGDTSAHLLTIWSTSWAIVLIFVVSVVAYGALRSMVGAGVSWLSYANLIETIPRLIFGLLAAFYSKQFFLMLINGNNALTDVFVCNTPQSMVDCIANPLTAVVNAHTGGIIDGLLQILYGLLGFFLIIEEIVRMAVIYLLFAFAPILFFFASLRETQRFAKTAAVASVLFIFLQAIQAATMDVGGQVLSAVAGQSGSLTFLNLMVSLAILGITLMLFFSITQLAFGVAGLPLSLGVSRAMRPVSRALIGAGTEGAATLGFLGMGAGRVGFNVGRAGFNRLTGRGNTSGPAGPPSGSGPAGNSGGPTPSGPTGTSPSGSAGGGSGGGPAGGTAGTPAGGAGTPQSSQTGSPLNSQPAGWVHISGGTQVGSSQQSGAAGPLSGGTVADDVTRIIQASRTPGTGSAGQQGTVAPARRSVTPASLRPRQSNRPLPGFWQKTPPGPNGLTDQFH